MSVSVGHLFAGIDGFGLGLASAGPFRTRWTVEWADFPHSILSLREPDADHLRDVRDVVGPPAVDVLTGGFPCQDLSLAGRGAGIGGARSGLWSEYARIVGEVRPRVVLVENVPALLHRGLEVVLDDLVALGYAVEWDCIPAAAVGAPHLRDRVWVVAHKADAPVVFGEPRSLFPMPVHRPVDGWARWPRAGFVAGSTDVVVELEPCAPLSAVKRGARLLLPTPEASDGSGGRVSAEVGGKRPSGAKRAVTLATAATRPDLWPTVAARDWKDTGDGRMGSGQLPEAVRAAEPRCARLWREGSGGDDLATSVHRNTPGALNPDWVEWLMGFPLGWTNPDASELMIAPWALGEPEGVPRVASNVPNRRERLTALGNALVPQIPALLADRITRLLS